MFYKQTIKAKTVIDLSLIHILNSRQKSIIDRCVRKLYIDIARSKEKYIPVMSDLDVYKRQEVWNPVFGTSRL